MDTKFYNIPGYKQLKIPVTIDSNFNESSRDWTFIVYVTGLNQLDLKIQVDTNDEEFYEIEQDSLTKLYEWLCTNIFPYVSQKHRDELCFGMGSHSNTEGIIDYIPSDDVLDIFL